MKAENHPELASLYAEQSRLLSDEHRLQSFRQAITQVVQPGDRVVELGASGLLSLWAAQCGAEVVCIDPSASALQRARQLLGTSPGRESIRWVQADYRDEVLSEPCSLVLCDLLHPALIESAQVAVCDDFRHRHQLRFGQTPRFLPDTTLLAVQAVQQDYDFHGCLPTLALFQQPDIAQTRTLGLGDPYIYHTVEYHLPASRLMRADLVLQAQAPGRLNALRFISKHLLAISLEQQTSTDWHSPYMVLPLRQTLELQAGDRLRLRFAYLAGSPLSYLQDSLLLEKIPQSQLQQLLGGQPMAATPVRAQA